MTDQTILTRRDLYELVWATPLSKLADQFGISDRGLAKICERHRVPSPPRGYWAKLEAGGKPKRAIFVEAYDADLNIVQINATLSKIPDEAREIILRAKSERTSQRTTRAKRKVQPAPEFPPVEQVHPVLIATAKALRKAKSQGTEIITISGDGLAKVRLGRESVARALAFLDALIRQLVVKGYAATTVKDGIKISLGPDEAVFTLKERTKFQPHEPTQEELAAEKRRQDRIARTQRSNSWDVKWEPQVYPDYDEIPQGEIVLEVEGYWDGVRRRWADGKTQTLEKLFDGIVLGFEVLLAARKARRLEREQREREWAELARRQQLAQERGKREKKRKTLFRNLMAKTTEASEIRKWLGTIDPDAVADEDGDFAKLIEWTKGRLATLENAVSGPRVAEAVREQQLFPKIDALHDPLGEPPRAYHYGASEEDD